MDRQRVRGGCEKGCKKFIHVQMSLPPALHAEPAATIMMMNQQEVCGWVAWCSEIVEFSF